jgi:CRP-like cAMP-binding protein
MSFLSALQGEELAVFEKYLVPTQFPRGACIMVEGDPGDGCYIVDEGVVRLELKNVETDTDSVLGFLESGRPVRMRTLTSKHVGSQGKAMRKCVNSIPEWA